MSGFADRIRGAYAGARLGFSDPMSLRPIIDPNTATAYLSPDFPADIRARYRMLELQKKNTIYREFSSQIRGIPMPRDYSKIRALENPALEAVVFHVMHVFPGSLKEALPLDLPADSPLAQAAYRVLRASWFGTQKDRLVDVSATFGDAFIGCWSTPDRVGMTIRDPADVSEFEEDSEGNIVYIRLDQEVPGEPGQRIYRTEAWSKEDNLYARWYHRLGLDVPFENLRSDPDAARSGDYLEKRITDFGYDFVPYVRAPFGQGYAPSMRSTGVFELHREAIDDHLRSLTVLRDRYFRHGKPLWQSITEQEKAVDYVEKMAKQRAEADKSEDPNSGRFPDTEEFIRNPKGTRLEALIPAIDWSAGLDQINDSRLALERSMPELRFFRGHDSGDPSGAAMDRHQSPAIRRARAARGNYEEAILKAIKMCLSKGTSRKLFDVGSFDAGDFDELSFKARPIIPETESESIATLTGRAEMYATLREVSPELLKLQLAKDGYDPEKIEVIVASVSGGDDVGSIMRRALGGTV